MLKPDRQTQEPVSSATYTEQINTDKTCSHMQNPSLNTTEVGEKTSLLSTHRPSPNPQLLSQTLYLSIQFSAQPSRVTPSTAHLHKLCDITVDISLTPNALISVDSDNSV